MVLQLFAYIDIYLLICSCMGAGIWKNNACKEAGCGVEMPVGGRSVIKANI